MMAPVGGTRKVMGRRMATPLTEPKPGMAPMKRPTVQPKMTSPRFSGWKTIKKPLMRRLKVSILANLRGKMSDV